MKPYTLFLAGIASLVVTADYLLLPDSREQTTMLERDGQHISALKQLESDIKVNADNSRTISELYKQYVRFGEVERAGDMLERFSNIRTNDIGTLRELVKFYRGTHKPMKYLAALEQLFARAPTKEHYRQLVGYYRLHGLFGPEEKAMKVAVAKRIATPSDYSRLGAIAARRGDAVTAVEYLRIADGALPHEMRHARLALFDLLIDLGRMDEAYTRALSWSARWRDHETGMDFVTRLTEAGRDDLAGELGTIFDNPGDSILLVSAELFNKRQRHAEARKLLKTYLQGKPPKNPNLASYYIFLALDAKAVGLALEATQAVAMEDLPTPTFRSLADAAMEFNETNSLKELPKDPALSLARVVHETQGWKRTSPPVSAAAARARMVSETALELFAAKALLVLGKRPDPETILAKVDISTVPTVDLTSWLETISSHIGAKRTLPILDAVLKWRGLSEQDLRDLSEDYKDAGLMTEFLGLVRRPSNGSAVAVAAKKVAPDTAPLVAP